MPKKKIKPDPNNQIAAGSGMAETNTEAGTSYRFGQ
jgi:hypothetical protein